MLRLAVCWWVLAWMFAPGGAQAAADVARDAMIVRILTLSGMEHQLDDVALLARDEVEIRKAGLASEEYARLQGVMGKAFAAQTLRAYLLEGLTRRYDAQRFAAWAQMLDSPQVKKMEQLEQRAASPDAAHEIRALAARLPTRPPAKVRVELLRRLDVATGATELALTSQLAVTRAFLYAVEPSLLPNRRLTPKGMEDAISAVRLRIEPSLRDLALASALYAYRGLSDRELQQYVTLQESGAGQWDARITGEAMQEVLHRAIEGARSGTGVR